MDRSLCPGERLVLPGHIASCSDQALSLVTQPEDTEKTLVTVEIIIEIENLRKIAPVSEYVPECSLCSQQNDLAHCRLSFVVHSCRPSLVGILPGTIVQVNMTAIGDELHRSYRSIDRIKFHNHVLFVVPVESPDICRNESNVLT